jgi:hypothetical protein
VSVRSRGREARVDARLAASRATPRRQLDAATLAKRRLALKHKALGSVAAAIPLTFVSLLAHGLTGGVYPIGPWKGTIVVLAVAWILIAGVYGVRALRLLPPRSDRDESYEGLLDLRRAACQRQHGHGLTGLLAGFAAALGFLAPLKSRVIVHIRSTMSVCEVVCARAGGRPRTAM